MHCFDELGFAEPTGDRLRRQLGETLLNPPDVSKWVADPADAVTPSQLGQLCHDGGAGFERLTDHGVRVGDVDAQVRPSVRPPGRESNIITTESPILTSACPIAPSSLTTLAISVASKVNTTNSINVAVLREMIHGVTVPYPSGTADAFLSLGHAHERYLSLRRRETCEPAVDRVTVGT